MHWARAYILLKKNYNTRWKQAFRLWIKLWVVKYQNTVSFPCHVYKSKPYFKSTPHIGVAVLAGRVGCGHKRRWKYFSFACFHFVTLCHSRYWHRTKSLIGLEMLLNIWGPLKYFQAFLPLIVLFKRTLKVYPYLIFVIFFTRAKFLENKIYTEKTRTLRQNTQ